MRLRILLPLLIITAILSWIKIAPIYAQANSIYCGSIITGEFTQDSQVLFYQILLNAEDRINISANGENGSMLFDLWLYGPTDLIIGGSNPGDIQYGGSPSISTPNFRSGILSASGLYTIRLTNSHFYPSSAEVYADNTSDSVGSFTLYIDCVHDSQPIPAGTPVPLTPDAPLENITITLPIIRSQSVTPLQCGQIISSEFTQNLEIQRYSIDISADDQAFWVTATPIGEYLRSSMMVFSPNGELAASSENNSTFVIPETSPTVRVDAALRSGSYVVTIGNDTLSTPDSSLGAVYLYRAGDSLTPPGGIGLYIIGAGCQFADGTIVNPGDLLTPEQPSALATQTPVAAVGSNLDTNCANSPNPRLAIGLQGQVMPGDANNVRSEPSGATVVGQIPGGEQFTVLEGPVCGINGLTFWRVQYGELTGWTAEGQGTEYWLEPIQSGRG